MNSSPLYLGTLYLFTRVEVGVILGEAIITEAVTRESPVRSPCCCCNIERSESRSSRGRHSPGVSTGSSEARLCGTRAYRAALLVRARPVPWLSPLGNLRNVDRTLKQVVVGGEGEETQGWRTV